MTFKIETLGCKVNQYESALIHEELIEAGLLVDEENPSVVIVNSCTVTSEADSKVLKLLRRLRKNYPQAVLVLTGCLAQVNPDTLAEYADLVIGGRDKEKVKDSVLQALAGKSPVLIHHPFNSKEEMTKGQAKGFPGHTRAFLKIQEGCNRYCAYCIIPTARGPLRHKGLEEIRQEVEGLVSSGYGEIVLVGINLAMYGDGTMLNLVDAVKTAAGVDGDFRLRLGSTEPELMTDGLLMGLKQVKKLCPSFHLPLQSGCYTTLKEMNRRYTPEEFRGRVQAVRRIFGEDTAISTDIMVGFPGESEEDFQQSTDFFGEMNFSDAHIFSYSPRAGTVAAERVDQIPAETKEKRSKILHQKLAETRSAYLNSRVGTLSEVIIEKNLLGGHDQYYCFVTLPSNHPYQRGEKVQVEIVTNRDGLHGEPRSYY